MEAIRKQIHTALFNVSRLCEQFFRKYPQYYPPQTPYENYTPYQYGGFGNPSNEFSPILPNNWALRYGGKPMMPGTNLEKVSNYKDNKIQQKDPKNGKLVKNQTAQSKKAMKDEKKQKKKNDNFRQQKQKQRIRQQALKMKKKQKNTKKNQIRKDSRYAEKPKFPMSPYFLFLKQMRANPAIKVEPNRSSNKQFAQQMGKAWRQMSQQNKKPYVSSYLKEKRIYDQKIKQFYQKYPDLKPRNSDKHQKPMYSVDDPKYQEETLNDQQELENDLIDELQSQEDSLSGPKFSIQTDLQNKQIYEAEKNIQEKINNFSWNKYKDSLNDERLTSEANYGNSPTHIVQIDS